MLLDISRYSLTTYKKELSALFALALPMLLSQVARVGTSFVDTVMAGGAGKEDLAAVALGSSLFVTIFVTMIGMMTALNPMIAQAYGASRRAPNPKPTSDNSSHTYSTLDQNIGELGRQGLWYGLFMGILGMIMMWGAITPFRTFFDLSAHTLDITVQYLWFVGLGMPAALIYQGLHAYVTSLNKTKAMMWISWLCFFVNIPLNWIFVYGKFGVPALGGAGCGVATAIVFWLNTLLLWIYIAKDRFFHPFGLTSRFSAPDLKTLKDITRLGLPIGLSFFIEVSLFTCIVFLLARLKGDAHGTTEDYVAAQQVVVSLSSLLFMIPQSMGISTTVRVGYNLGLKRPHQARYASGVAISTAMGIACLSALGLMLWRYPLARIYTDDLTVIAIVSNIIVYAATFQLVDAIQCVASYALRGYKVTAIPMFIHAIAFWGCGLAPGYVLAFYYGMGIYGFWTALVFSLMVAAVCLLWYLEVYSKRQVGA